jgi:hypothetical protein
VIWRAVLLLALILPSAASAGLECRATVRLPGGAATGTPCAGGDRLTIAAVGDVLLHSPLQRRGYAEGFGAIWRDAAAILSAADIAYANLEGPVAPTVTRGLGTRRDPGAVFDNVVFTSFPLFNYHPVIVTDLVRAGVDVVSTANNHAMDRGPDGATATIAHLRAAGLAFTGTRGPDAARAFAVDLPSRFGMIVFLACSYSTNGLADPHRQVLTCYDDRDEVLAEVTRQAARPEVAAVVVTPHWGDEYSPVPNARQRDLAADLIAAGATAVIGTHPHVVQPWDFIHGPGGYPRPAIYSTGNFISGQVSLPKQTGIVAWLELCRPRGAADPGRALFDGLEVSAAGWLAVHMGRGGEGPELTLATPSATGAATQARRLAAARLPDAELAVELSCQSLHPFEVALQ